MSAIAAEFDAPGSATYYEDPEMAHEVAGDDRTVLPIATVTNGSTRTLLVGIPDQLDAELGRDNKRFRVASDDTITLGTITTARTERLEGSTGTVTATVEPRERRSSLLDPNWYVTDTRTVERVGESGAFVVQVGTDTSNRADERSVPLMSALQFFLVGTSDVLRVFGAVAAGAGVLVGVTVFSVSRMSVRDRLSTIRVVRSTGGRPRTVLGLFTVRASLLTLVGIGLGYAMGIIVTNAAVNLAVTMGVPASLSLEAGPQAIRVLGVLYVTVIGIGGLAGALAAWPAVRRPPGRLIDDEPTRKQSGLVPERLNPSLLSWRALVPTTATLTTFVAFVVLVSAMASLAGPITTGEGATITTPGATNPINSNVPEKYTKAFHAQGINASAEILLFEMVGGRPVLARGVVYEDFASVTDARLVQGRTPAEPSEAVVGADLARTQGIEIGETLTLGGSVQVGLTRVEVVGTFVAPGPFDDQLLVSLSTARHLGVRSPGQVQLIRTDRLPPNASADMSGRAETGIGVVNVSVDGPIAPNSSFVTEVTLRNDGLRTERTTIPVTFGDQQRDVPVELGREQQRTVQVEFAAGPPGTYALEAGNTTTNVRVVDPDSIVINGVPERAPPESNPLVTVTDGTGRPVAGANVTVGNRTLRTDDQGRVRLPLSASGRVEITAQTRNGSTTRVVEITPDATRELSTGLGIRPTEPSVTTRPEARVVLRNPWAEPVNATVRIEGPGRSLERAVTVDPGRRTVVTTRLAERPPGSYDVRAYIDEREAGTIEYRVTGDRRIVSALATTGGGGTTGLSQGIEVLFGNLRILVAALLGLAAIMTIGGTTATFAQAVYARRRTIGIYRATGAPPRRILGLVLADAARIGIVASVAALVLALLALQVLDAAGYLTFYGVSLHPVPSPVVIAGIVAGSMCVTLVGATLTTLTLLRVPPASLLYGTGDAVQPGSSAQVNSDE